MQRRRQHIKFNMRTSSLQLAVLQVLVLLLKRSCAYSVTDHRREGPAMGMMSSAMNRRKHSRTIAPTPERIITTTSLSRRPSRMVMPSPFYQPEKSTTSTRAILTELNAGIFGIDYGTVIGLGICVYFFSQTKNETLQSEIKVESNQSEKYVSSPVFIKPPVPLEPPSLSQIDSIRNTTSPLTSIQVNQVLPPTIPPPYPPPALVSDRIRVETRAPLEVIGAASVLNAIRYSDLFTNSKDLRIEMKSLFSKIGSAINDTISKYTASLVNKRRIGTDFRSNTPISTSAVKAPASEKKDPILFYTSEKKSYSNTNIERNQDANGLGKIGARYPETIVQVKPELRSYRFDSNNSAEKPFFANTFAVDIAVLATNNLRQSLKESVASTYTSLTPPTSATSATTTMDANESRKDTQKNSPSSSPLPQLDSSESVTRQKISYNPTKRVYNKNNYVMLRSTNYLDELTNGVKTEVKSASISINQITQVNSQVVPLTVSKQTSQTSNEDKDIEKNNVTKKISYLPSKRSYKTKQATGMVPSSYLNSLSESSTQESNTNNPAIVKRRDNLANMKTENFTSPETLLSPSSMGGNVDRVFRDSTKVTSYAPTGRSYKNITTSGITEGGYLNSITEEKRTALTYDSAASEQSREETVYRTSSLPAQESEAFTSPYRANGVDGDFTNGDSIIEPGVPDVSSRSTANDSGESYRSALTQESDAFTSPYRANGVDGVFTNSDSIIEPEVLNVNSRSTANDSGESYRFALTQESEAFTSPNGANGVDGVFTNGDSIIEPGVPNVTSRSTANDSGESYRSALTRRDNPAKNQRTSYAPTKSSVSQKNSLSGNEYLDGISFLIDDQDFMAPDIPNYSVTMPVGGVPNSVRINERLETEPNDSMPVNGVPNTAQITERVESESIVSSNPVRKVSYLETLGGGGVVVVME